MNSLSMNSIPSLRNDSPTIYPESADGTLVIMVVRAKHLPNRRKLDKQSPYVTVRLGTTAKKTPAAFRGGQVPEWTHEIRFPLTRDRKPILKLDVLDETKGDPTPIGNAEIDCSVLFTREEENGKYIYDNWFELSQGGKRAGMVYLEMTFYPSAPVLPSKIPIYPHDQVVTQEENYDVHDSYHEQPVYHRPQVPHKEDVFVNSESSTSSKGSSTFSHNTGKHYNESTGTVNSASAVFVNEQQYQENLKGAKKYALKFAKLKSKFNTREPLNTLWGGNESSTLSNHLSSSPSKRVVSPLSEYGSDDNSPYSHHEEDIQFISPPEPPRRDFKIVPPPRSPTPPPKSPSKSPLSESRRSPRRKPPADIPFEVGKLKDSTSIPFSADTIGLEDSEGLPTKVYLLDQPVKSLSYSADNIISPVKLKGDEIDPRYYAPTPSEHFNRNSRLTAGSATKDDLKVDLNTSETGYIGNGKFSPSVFQRIGRNYWSSESELDQQDKPKVPPKIPEGLTEAEYYVLEKEKFLRDL
ncbi:uncharacterized protein SPAPADRAFT_59835, partial [Spathaspora passalidarum NRRL Y-27907]